jgi:hypothetical protein
MAAANPVVVTARKDWATQFPVRPWGSTAGWKYEWKRCRQVRGDSANDKLFMAGLANQPDVSLRQSEWFITASKL